MLNTITKRLALHSPSPRLDAELLLAAALNVSRAYLYTHFVKNLTQDQSDILEASIQRREQGEPIAYILGKQAFWSLDLEVNSNTLIPRPSTELLVELALQSLPAESALHVIDLGTGSGAIAIAIARERPHWQIIASDNYSNTLATAKHNAKRYALKNIRFVLSDWCRQLQDLRADAVISNPPYIQENDNHLKQGDLRFEPKRALVAGNDGLSAIRIVIAESYSLLKDGGYLFVEHGFDQGESVRKLLKSEGYYGIQQHRDLDRHERVVIGIKGCK